LGTREAIERAGLEDFADLLIALAQNNLSLPKPVDTPERRANVDMARAALQPRLRRATDFSTLDEHLETEGTREDFQAVAIKDVLAWQIEQAMKAHKLSRKRLAERMGTSRSQAGRLLEDLAAFVAAFRQALKPATEAPAR
jgi:predicted XRE-type DNA-binding protein